MIPDANTLGQLAFAIGVLVMALLALVLLTSVADFFWGAVMGRADPWQDIREIAADRALLLADPALAKELGITGASGDEEDSGVWESSAPQMGSPAFP